jgi:hypothetical protein
VRTIEVLSAREWACLSKRVSNEPRSGPTNSDSAISAISARMGDGVVRKDGEEDDPCSHSSRRVEIPLRNENAYPRLQQALALPHLTYCQTAPRATPYI